MKSINRTCNFVLTLVLLVVSSLFVIPAFATGIAVPTNIINAPKAQFIGSMVTVNNDSIGKIPASVTALNPQFKDCAACNTWFNDSVALPAVSGLYAKFTNAGTQKGWAANGAVGFIGSCVSSQTGDFCPANATPE